MKFLNWLFGRTALMKRNDWLVAQNNRLGLEILALRKLKIPKRKVDGRAKDFAIREASLEVKKYKLRVASQRQHLIVRKLRQHVPADTFQAICTEVGNMTDEQVAAA